MAETASTDNLSVATLTSRPRSRKRATVSASALAQHLDCSRSYIGKLEAEGYEVTTSRTIRTASPTCDTCGVSGSNRRAVNITDYWNNHAMWTMSNLQVR